MSACQASGIILRATYCEVRESVVSSYFRKNVLTSQYRVCPCASTGFGEMK